MQEMGSQVVVGNINDLLVVCQYESSDEKLGDSAVNR